MPVGVSIAGTFSRILGDTHLGAGLRTGYRIWDTECLNDLQTELIFYICEP